MCYDYDIRSMLGHIHSLNCENIWMCPPWYFPHGPGQNQFINDYLKIGKHLVDLGINKRKWISLFEFVTQLTDDIPLFDNVRWSKVEGGVKQHSIRILQIR